MDIDVLTSSPLYPKSNGFSERCVQTGKKLIQKCKEDNTSLWTALLEYRNTPIKNSLYSPAQLMMGRQTRTLVPGKDKLFKNENICANVASTLKLNNLHNKKFYDQSSKSKPNFEIGEKVWMREGKYWFPAMIKDVHTKSPRSYYVQLQNGKTVRRNSIFIRKRVE